MPERHFPGPHVEHVAALKIVKFYTLLATAWLLFTDILLYIHGGESWQLSLMSAGKGILSIALTGIAIYFYMTRWIGKNQKEREILDQRLSQLSKYANDIVLLFDGEGRIIDANDRAADAYQIPIAELTGKSVADLRAKTGSDWRKDWQHVIEHGNLLFESVHVRADGSRFPVEVSSRRIDGHGQPMVQSIARDISERRKAEQQIAHLKDIYAALSQTNQSIVRIRSKDELFKRICEIAVEYCHFRLAWLGMIDEKTKRVIPAQANGPDTSYLDGIEISADPASVFNSGPIGQAIQTGRPIIVNDVQEQQTIAPWKERLRQFSFRSGAAFPLFFHGRCIGALTLYAADPGYFTPEFITLLNEMAGDISFALDQIALDEERQRLEKALSASNARLNGIIEGSQDLIAAVDTEMRLTLCNSEQQSLMHHAFKSDICLGTDLSRWRTSTVSQMQMMDNCFRQALHGKVIKKSWGALIDQEETFFESYFAPLLDTSGQPVGAFHIGRNVTEHKQMETSLRKLTVAVEQSPVTVIITDLQGNIEYVNPAFTATSGYTAEEALGQNPKILKSGETGSEEYRAMWQSITNGRSWFGVFHNKHKDGTLYWEEAVVAPVRDKAGTIREFIAIKNNITARLEAEERANFLTFHDPLTRLPNRNLVRTSTDSAIAHARQIGCKAALFSIDVDRFEKINESLGFRVGDQLLQALAARFSKELQKDDVLCRLGGDEFLLLFSEVRDSDSLTQIAAKIQRLTKTPFKIEDFEISVTFSSGISVYPDHSEDPEILHRQADLALFTAKKSGRNTYRIYSPELESNANEYLLILNGLRKALDRSEFHIEYQPQINLKSGNLVGAEALIRWNHPQLGPIPPGRFISIAEDSGLIFEIGKWVLSEACHQTVKWNQMGIRDLQIAVNLSAVQMRRAELPEIVAKILAESHLSPFHLCLELTESSLVENAQNAVEILKKLKSFGVHLSLDDFGTEYASFTYLRTFHLDELKIDQSFIRGIVSNSGDERIVRSIIELAKGFGLTTIAEGVETETVFDAISATGCDTAQGFYLARPMSASAFQEYALAKRADGPV